MSFHLRDDCKSYFSKIKTSQSSSMVMVRMPVSFNFFTNFAAPSPFLPFFLSFFRNFVIERLQFRLQS